MYHFKVSQKLAQYHTNFTDDSSRTYFDGTIVKPKLIGDVCIPCDRRCRYCTNSSHTQCS